MVGREFLHKSSDLLWEVERGTALVLKSHYLATERGGGFLEAFPSLRLGIALAVLFPEGLRYFEGKGKGRRQNRAIKVKPRPAVMAPSP